MKCAWLRPVQSTPDNSNPRLHKPIFLSFQVIFYIILPSITRTPDNSNLFRNSFSISLEGSSYGESTVVFYPNLKYLRVKITVCMVTERILKQWRIVARNNYQNLRNVYTENANLTKALKPSLLFGQPGLKKKDTVSYEAKELDQKLETFLTEAKEIQFGPRARSRQKYFHFQGQRVC